MTLIALIQMVLPQTASVYAIFGWTARQLRSLRQRQILGTTPSVVKNQVYRNIEDIVHRFGHRVNAQTQQLRKGSLTTIVGAKGEGVLPAGGSSAIPMDVLKRLRIYAGSDPIVWPDITALRSWIKTRNWPDAYNITYQQLNQRDFKRDRVQAENDVLACALLYTTIPAQRLDRYWDEMDQLDKAVAGGEVREQEVTNEVLDAGFKLTA